MSDTDYKFAIGEEVIVKWNNQGNGTPGIIKALPNRYSSYEAKKEYLVVIDNPITKEERDRWNDTYPSGGRERAYQTSYPEAHIYKLTDTEDRWTVGTEVEFDPMSTNQYRMGTVEEIEVWNNRNVLYTLVDNGGKIHKCVLPKDIRNAEKVQTQKRRWTLRSLEEIFLAIKDTVNLDKVWACDPSRDLKEQLGYDWEPLLSGGQQSRAEAIESISMKPAEPYFEWVSKRSEESMRRAIYV